MRILLNRAKCKLCGNIIESKYRHDWVACECGEIFVDGGHEYFRRGANNFENFIDMSVQEDDTEEQDEE
jgi:hypothetical protein